MILILLVNICTERNSNVPFKIDENGVVHLIDNEGNFVGYCNQETLEYLQTKYEIEEIKET